MSAICLGPVISRVGNTDDRMSVTISALHFYGIITSQISIAGHLAQRAMILRVTVTRELMTLLGNQAADGLNN